jgi:chromosome segregation ATPase
MKSTIYSMVFTALSAVLFTACQPSTDQQDQTQAEVETVKQELQDVKDDTKQNAVSLANAEELKAYRSNSQTTIDNYETRIAQLNEEIKRSDRKENADYILKIQALEQRNKELKTKMDYYETNQSDWVSFKTEYDNNIDELGQALKDLTLNIKK